MEVEEAMGFPTVTLLHALPFSVGDDTQNASHPIATAHDAAHNTVFATLAATSPILDVLPILPALIPNSIIKNLLNCLPLMVHSKTKHH